MLVNERPCRAERPERRVFERTDTLKGRQKMTRIFAAAALAAVTILGATFAAGVLAQASERAPVTIHIAADA